MGVFPTANAAVGASIADRTTPVPAMVAMVYVCFSLCLRLSHVHKMLGSHLCI